ncbi:hypothetical protein EYF80_044126 [Liparis tanakae]|uniref:Uncharacterized protein n=1 Tax=Liparis tanakae TaxID=230148 RepID=A0A4Z2FWN1_9TELE|nr:hypothetical protein EYF80_044126 [Liparis tanakae]
MLGTVTSALSLAEQRHGVHIRELLLRCAAYLSILLAVSPCFHPLSFHLVVPRQEVNDGGLVIRARGTIPFIHMVHIMSAGASVSQHASFVERNQEPNATNSRHLVHSAARPVGSRGWTLGVPGVGGDVSFRFHHRVESLSWQLVAGRSTRDDLPPDPSIGEEGKGGEGELQSEVESQPPPQPEHQQQDTQPQPQCEAQPHTHPQPQPEAYPQPEPEPEPEPEPKSQPAPEPEYQYEYEYEPEPEPQPEPQPQVEAPSEEAAEDAPEAPSPCREEQVEEVEEVVVVVEQEKETLEEVIEAKRTQEGDEEAQARRHECKAAREKEEEEEEVEDEDEEGGGAKGGGAGRRASLHHTASPLRAQRNGAGSHAATSDYELSLDLKNKQGRGNHGMIISISRTVKHPPFLFILIHPTDILQSVDLQPGEHEVSVLLIFPSKSIQISVEQSDALTVLPPE